MNARTVDLMLQYRIQLRRCEPTTHFNADGTYCTGNGILHDPDGTFHLDPWTDAEWANFRTNFVDVITRVWDRKFELSPSRPWYEPRPGAGGPEAARVTCSLSIGLVDTPAQAHHRYFIIKPQETTFRAFTVRSRRLGMFTHRNLALEWHTAQTRMGADRHSVSYLQNAVLHEFGHTLGLHHVNGRGNSAAHYGITLEQSQDVMGRGHHASERGAQPWISQLRHHVIPTRREPPLRFTGRVVGLQLITYWDNDWAPPAAAAP
jgi:hypothetical protein